MRITLIGGHGKVALLAAPKLVAAGHDVTSVIRNPDQAASVEATGAHARVADMEHLDTTGLTALVGGSDVVIWSAGAGGGNPDRTYAVDRDAAIRTMDAAAAAGVERFVMVSYLGAGTPERPHRVPESDPFFAYAEAKAAADDHLRHSSLRWTILRPSALTLEPSRGTLDPQPAGRANTSRELVADVIVGVVDAPEDAVASRDFDFTDGDVPVEEALRTR